MNDSMVDQVTPGEKWVFDDSVTAVFDNMLERSIPQYTVMRQAVFDLACAYVQPKTALVDLGCARGEALAPLIDKFGAQNRYIGIDVSEPMLQAARERYAGYIQTGTVDIRNLDLRTCYPLDLASVTLCILTLQFTPLEYRQQILRRIWKQTIKGGAFLFVEKILGATADLDELMVKTYYSLKAQNGYTQEQIERKRLSLEGVLVPVTAKWNEELLHQAGFTQIDCFWRWMNFAGWIAIKE